MDLAAQLSARIGAIFVELGLPVELGRVARAQKPEFGHFQCNGAMAGAKASGTNPRELATRVAGRLAGDPDLARVEVAGPGFLNLTLSDEALARQAGVLGSDPRAGASVTTAPMTVVVDYGGPNVAKPMHVGHLRSAIIGESLKRLFRFAGHTVHGDAHFGDWGFQMGLLIVAVGEEKPGLVHLDPAFSGPYPEESPVTLADLERLYPAASGRVKARDTGLIEAARKATAELQRGRAGYVALWRHFQAVSRVALERDYGVLGVHFDLWNGESDADPFIAPMVADLDARGLLADDAGARVIFVHDRIVPKKDGGEGPDIPPLLVVSSEGSAMYGTTDLATIVQRKEVLRPDLSLYVVDQRQADHFEQVFRAADRAGYMARASLEHIGFGTMNGKDGKPFKTRDGGVLKLSDLIAMVQDQARAKLAETGMADSLPPEERDTVARKVGMAALKFADLQNYRGTSYQFDLDRFLSFEGKTGPYLLYAAVRIASILRKAEEQGANAGEIAITGQAERDLILTLDGFDTALGGALDKRAPHVLAEHVYAVASAFSAFYTQCPILGSDGPVRASRLALSQLTLKQLQVGFELLGLEAPERM